MSASDVSEAGLIVRWILIGDWSGVGGKGDVVGC